METATCRTSTGTVNLIGGSQDKGVIRAVGAELFNEEKCGNFSSFAFSQKYGPNTIVARNQPSTSRFRPDEDRC